jgi:alkanesulfonate monooxygenase SsuD/methylene tetrahydromethanopterin reductase-like flavin-dependent oxidoreductase (luciferase family)
VFAASCTGSARATGDRYPFLRFRQARRPPPGPGPAGRVKKTLRLVARYGGACNLFATSSEEVTHKLDVLRRHCDTEGRDHDEIRKTMTYIPAGDDGDLDASTRDISGYAKLGIDTVILAPRTGAPAAWIERFAAPAVRRLAELD